MFYVFRMRPSTLVQFQFVDMQVLSSTDECGDDYLIIRNGERRTSPFFLINPHQVGFIYQ